MFECRRLGQIAKTGYVEVVAHLLEHLVVPFTSHLIEYYASNANILAEIDETLQQWRHRIGGTLGVNHQHDGDVQHAGNLCAGALVAVVAVEESHHTLNDTHVGILTVMVEEFADVLRRRHKRVEVDAGPMAHRFVELRVDIVGPAFERLNAIAFLRQQRHQPSGNSRLA